MLSSLLHFTLIISCSWLWATPLVSPPAVRRGTALHLPLSRRAISTSVRRQVPEQGFIGLGDYIDVTYSVLVQIGETLLPLIVDTGSSDLWVLTSTCSADCYTATVPLYPQTSFRPSGLSVRLSYGDSRTGTYAQGPVGVDTAGIANFWVRDQFLAAILETNTSILQTDTAGIFGLGFPINSVILNTLLATSVPQRTSLDILKNPSFSTRGFPDLTGIRGHRTPATRSEWARSLSPSVNDVLASFATNGPLIPRLILAGALASPIVAISLQRDAIEIGGNQGILSIGELPPGIAAEDMCWVPLRGYTVAEGGLPPPEDSPNEVYPITWEVTVDDVYFDGRKLPRSALVASNITLTALLDTGNSLIRGPKDVLEAITAQLGGATYDCAEAHTLAFQIGGNMYPVDPRDFGSQTFEDTTSQCTPNLSPTDPPSSGFLYSWSIGDPFLKSAFVAFYYGNITHPSQDRPRIGLLSTVPSDAAQRLQAAVEFSNVTLGGNLPVAFEGAPSGTPSLAGTGIKQSSLPSQISYTSSATMKRMSVSPVSPASIIALLTIAFAMFAMS